MTPAAVGPELALFAVVLFGAAALGGLIPVLSRRDGHSDGFIFSFGAGLLLGTAFLHMIPEAFRRLGPPMGVAVLAGFVLLLGLEKFLMVDPCEEAECDYHRLGLSAWFGISLHSLVDGVALGSSLGNLRLSILVFSAILVHKIPYAFSLGGLLCLGRFSRRQRVVLVIIFAALTPLGAVVTWMLARDAAAPLLGWAMGFSAGNFIFIAVSHLLPQIKLHSKKARRQLVYLLAGLAITLAGVLFEL